MTHSANTIFVPVMASRLMLSLKKATVQPSKPWSLDTMTTVSQGTSTDDGRTGYSAQRVRGGLDETSPTPAVPNEEDIELGAVPRLPRNRESRYEH